MHSTTPNVTSITNLLLFRFGSRTGVQSGVNTTIRRKAPDDPRIMRTHSIVRDAWLRDAICALPAAAATTDKVWVKGSELSIVQPLTARLQRNHKRKQPDFLVEDDVPVVYKMAMKAEI